MYVAANISNPLFLPFLLLAQIQVGRHARRGDFYPLTPAGRTPDAALALR